MYVRANHSQATTRELNVELRVLVHIVKLPELALLQHRDQPQV
jgi:hypothetical protein